MVLLTAAGLVQSPDAAPGLAAYLVLLCAACLSPLVLVRNVQSGHILLLAFLAFYFSTFGLKDLSDLLGGLPVSPRPKLSILTHGEVVILAGALLVVIGYIPAAAVLQKCRSRALTRDWSPGAAVVVGFVCWCIGAYYNTIIQFGIGDRNADGATLGILGGFFALFRVLGPLGVSILVYSYVSRQRKLALVLLLIALAGDLVLGFLGDSKETAFRGPILFLFAYAVLKRKVPIVAAAVVVLGAGLAFDYFAAYRHFLGTRDVSRADAVSQAVEDFDRVAGSNEDIIDRFSAGLDYAASRVTLKANVSLIVDRSGVDVDYQNGYTIAPILLAFVPRFILPDKQDSSATGLIFNDEFDIAAEGVYISVSNIGDLYWNFGWPGVVVGMIVIGAVLGLVGKICRLDIEPTLPKFLLLMLTVYLLILRFESGLAMVYTYWARAVVLFLLLHFIVPKARRESAGNGIQADRAM